ncbi:hypothetical protein D3C75_905200 [compost metagenome]
MLKVTQGLYTLISEKPLCRMPASIKAVSCFSSLEKDWATKVAPAERATSNGDRVDSMEPPGVLLVLKPKALRGEVCPLVSP